MNLLAQIGTVPDSIKLRERFGDLLVTELVLWAIIGIVPTMRGGFKFANAKEVAVIGATCSQPGLSGLVLAGPGTHVSLRAMGMRDEEPFVDVGILGMVAWMLLSGIRSGVRRLVGRRIG